MSRPARRRVSSKKQTSLCAIVMTIQSLILRKNRIGDVPKLTYKGVSSLREFIRWLIGLIPLPEQLDFRPSKQSLPFLPKTPRCLKPGQLAKVIAKTGQVVVGRIRYCGPVASSEDSDEIYVGLQLPHALGDCDGSFGGQTFFDW